MVISIVTRTPGVPRDLGLQNLNFSLICSLALLFISAVNYGFSDQAFASTQAATAFTKQFGKFNPERGKYVLSTLYLSLLNSLKAGTQLVGVFIGSWISKHYGRRWCICLMSVYALCSTAVLVSSTSSAQMLTGRSIHYIYLGMQMIVIPIYLAEISPANLRGSTGTLYWLAIKCGGLLVTGIVRATSEIKDNRAWRIPMALIWVIPTFLVVLVWFIPESPRWLLLNDHHEAALAALTRLRQSRHETRAKAVPSEAIMFEFAQLSDAIYTVREVNPSHQSRIRNFLNIFTRPHLKRTVIVIALLFFQQSTGQAFASQYGTLFVKALQTVNAFSITLGTNAVDIVAILICMLLADRLGRRPVLITSAAVQTAALMTMGALGTADAGETAAKEGIVAMLMLYMFGWSVGYAPLAYVVASELPAVTLREETLRVGYSVKLIMEFVISFTYPYLEDVDEANLGGRLGFIYGSVAFLAVIFSVVWVPETTGAELEDMPANLRTGVLGNDVDVEDKVPRRDGAVRQIG